MIRGVAKALPYLLYAPALLPLVYIDGLLYPFVAPKTLLLRGLGIILLAAFAFLALSGKPLFWHRLHAKVAWVPGALLVVAHVTSFFGIDFYHSFWSIFDRGDGLLTLTVIVGYFYIALLTADKLFLDRLGRIVTWAGSLVALYTALQWLQGTTGMDIPMIAEPRGRYGGTLGNAAFLAAYLGMTFFVTLIIAPLYRSRWRTAAYIGAGLQIAAILVSATRGTLLALIAATGLAALYLAWKGEGRIRTYARTGLVILVILAGIFFVFRSQFAQVPIEPIRRLATISVTEGTVSSRLFVWDNVYKEALQRPFMGYGAEHVDVLFNRVYDPSGIQEQWFDRSHNAYLDYFVQFGAFGLLLYLALIAGFAWNAMRIMRTDERRGGLLLLLVITYAIQNFFVFDTAMTLWLFFALFAGTYAARMKTAETTIRVPRLAWLPHGVAAVILLLLIPVFLQPLRANIALAQGYYYHIADPRKAVEKMQNGLELGTYADLEYGYQAYQMYTDRQQTMLSGEARIIAYQYAADVLAENYERYSYDARTATYYAHVLDSTPPEIPVDEEKLRSVAERARELSPKRMQPWYILANISLKKGDKASTPAERTAFYHGGIPVLEEYAAIMPKLAEPRYVLATLYITIGDRELARKWADEGLSVYVPDHATAKRASAYYISVEDWPNAARFLEEVLAGVPDDYDVQYDLAKVKWLARDTVGAREIVERIKEEAPGLFESDPAFMAEYNSERQ